MLKINAAIDSERHSKKATSSGRGASLAHSFARPRRILLTAGIFIFVLLGLIGAVIAIVVQAENAQDRVRESIQARSGAEALVGVIREAELQQRNLIISDEPEYRSRFDDALKQIPIHLLRLAAAVEEVSQLDRLQRLATIIDSRIKEMDEVISALEIDGEERAFQILEENERRGSMSAIADIVTDFDTEEDRIQSIRELRETQLRIWLVPTLVLAAILALMLGFVWIRQERSLGLRLVGMNRELEHQVLERTAALENERRRVETLLADMSHRIGNSLAMVSAFLSLEARRSTDTRVSDALESANRRVAGIASAQRRLRIAADNDEVALGQYLTDLVHDLRNTLASPGVSIRISADPIMVDSHDAVAVGIILNELVTNALKHAFRGSEAGLIQISLTRKDSSACLSVADDGSGMAAPARDGESLGLRVIRNMVTSLHGELTCAPHNPQAVRTGTEWRLTFRTAAI